MSDGLAGRTLGALAPSGPSGLSDAEVAGVGGVPGPGVQRLSRAWCPSWRGPGLCSLMLPVASEVPMRQIDLTYYNEIYTIIKYFIMDIISKQFFISFINGKIVSSALRLS